MNTTCMVSAADEVLIESEFSLRQFHLMGIVNVTPDSFSDGGQFFSPENACTHARHLWEAGADYVDLGAESTRPGATPLSAIDEWGRLKGVLQELVKHKTQQQKISVDTYHEDTMVKALELGADMINNINGLASPAFLQHMAAQYPEASYLGMHIHGTPLTMQTNPLKGSEALTEVSRFFRDSYARLREVGFSHERIFLDPGVGFGKNDPANWALIQHASDFAQTCQVAYGISRKGFIGRHFNIQDLRERDLVSKGLEIGLIHQGVSLIRTHWVSCLRQDETKG